jgi:CheY-like chemotaxis protein
MKVYSETTNWCPVKLLIVDDNETMRMLMKSLTQRISHETRECSDGSEALQMYREFRPDWVLMDIQMDKMDGITATRQIKSAYPDAKVIIITAYDDADLRESAKDAGAHDFILKEELLQISSLLRA